MSKRFCLCLYISALSILLLSAIALSTSLLKSDSDKTSDRYFSVNVCSGENVITINPWRDNTTGYLYVFLPSFADCSNSYISNLNHKDIYIDNEHIYDGYRISELKFDSPLSFISKECNIISSIFFIQSANVGTIFMNTASGSMSKIHSNKDYSESANIKVFEKNGLLNVNDEGKIKGRGNSTWRADKKPYLITLSSDYSLLGMKQSKKWVLLANAYDETNIRNKMVYDFCRTVGGVYAPESRYVDLYLNGEYAGLYLLTEKITSADDSVIPKLDFLCHIFSSSIAQKNCFTSKKNQYVQIDFPENVSNSELKRIQSIVQNMEDKISGENHASSLADVADIDSWARKYLIDEIFENSDAGSNSFYFYSLKNNENIYAGPLWDYDQILGSNRHNADPECLLAKKEWVNRNWYTPYYEMLNKNDYFSSTVSDVYYNEFVPHLIDLYQGGIEEYSRFISKPSAMNSIRWRNMFESLQVSYGSVVNTPRLLSEFLENRVEFLNSALTEKQEWCNVLIETEIGADYECYTVQKGASFDDFLKSKNIHYGSNSFIDSYTGKICTDNMTVYDGMIIIQQCSAIDYLKIHFEDFSYLFCIGIFILVFIIFIIKEQRIIKREKPQIEQYKKTIPS